MADIVSEIEKLNENDHIIIGSILRKFPNVKLNENKSGVMINFSTVPEETIEEIRKYLDYVKVQRNLLEKMEVQAEEYKTSFFQEN